MPTDTIIPLSSWDSQETWATFENGNFHGWIGEVEIQKSDDDLERYAELIEVSQPDLVIETGTRQGGSALWFRQRGLQVITIDINPNAGAEARKQAPRGTGIHWWNGMSSCHLPSFADALQRLAKGKRVMVSLDSDHHSGHVQAEIEALSQFVSPGCYLVIEDACFDMWVPERARVGGARIPELGGPYRAILESRALLEDRFWRDEAVEGLTSISHSPCGWWRRHDV